MSFQARVRFRSVSDTFGYRMNETQFKGNL